LGNHSNVLRTELAVNEANKGESKNQLVLVFIEELSVTHRQPFEF